MQNKPNVKMGKMNISTAKIKAYAKEQRTMSTARYSKQSQIKANFKRRNSSVVRKIAPYRTCNDYRASCSARRAAATLRRAFWAAHSHSAAGPSDPALGPFAAARRVYWK